MRSRTIHKKVGKVDIFEFQGEVTGTEAEASADRIQKSSENPEPRSVLFHADLANQIEEVALQAMTVKARKSSKSAVLSHDAKLSERLHVSAFQNKRVAAFYFAHDFVDGRSPEVVIGEKRRFPRLKAALPLHFSFEKGSGERVHFFAIVTNLSQTGLYAEFIETSSESLMRQLDVYDLKLMDLELHLTPTESVQLRAKAVRKGEEDSGIAMEFYESEAEEKLRFQEWLDQEFKQESNKS